MASCTQTSIARMNCIATQGACRNGPSRTNNGPSRTQYGPSGTHSSLGSSTNWHSTLSRGHSVGMPSHGPSSFRIRTSKSCFQQVNPHRTIHVSTHHTHRIQQQRCAASSALSGSWSERGYTKGSTSRIESASGAASVGLTLEKDPNDPNNPNGPKNPKNPKGPNGPLNGGAQASMGGSTSGAPVGTRGQGSKLITWGLILRLIWEQRVRVAVALVALLGGTVCNICIPKTSGGFIQSIVTPDGKNTSILKMLVPLAALYAFEPLCTMLYVNSLCSAWEKLVSALRMDVFRRILSQEISYFDKYKVSELTALLSTELNFVEKAVMDNVSRDRGLRSLCEVASSLTMIFLLCPDLAPVLVALVFGISLSAGFYKKSVVSVMKASLAAQSRLLNISSETLSAIRTVRSFAGESRQLGLYSGAVESAEQLGSKMSFAKSASEAWTRGSVYVSLLGIYALCGARVRSGQLLPGTLLAFVGYIFILTFAIQGFLNTVTDMQNVSAAVSRINALVPSEPDVQQHCPTDVDGEADLTSGKSNGTGRGEAEVGHQGPCVCYAIEAAWHGDVNFEGVRFAYPQRPNVDVLKGLNLHLPRGSVTALVGGSGAGKTTVVQLLSRFYEPSEGQIKLGKWNIGAFSRRDWGQSVALVSQEPVLFAMSVRENIAYGRPEEEDITDDRIIAAAKAANAHDFISSLPEGYDTKVGERGGLLSGGQRQRIAIARAVIKDAPILILDEATSALDSVSERLVQEAINKLMKGRTTVIIAHRLSTVQQADNIVVLDKGGIVEQGSHLELLRKEGAYSELVNSQHLTFAA